MSGHFHGYLALLAIETRECTLDTVTSTSIYLR